jgi:hypothetical protein
MKSVCWIVDCFWRWKEYEYYKALKWNNFRWPEVSIKKLLSFLMCVLYLYELDSKYWMLSYCRLYASFIDKILILIAPIPLPPFLVKILYLNHLTIKFCQRTILLEGPGPSLFATVVRRSIKFFPQMTFKRQQEYFM